MAERTFVKFTFLKIDPAWQRRDGEARAQDKRELLAACEDYATDRPLRAYSTVGTRGDCDMLIVTQSPRLDEIHSFHVVLAQSGLARWATIPHSYLAMTKPSPYSESETRTELLTSQRRYAFIYPMEKKREWYRLDREERGRIMRDHIETGRRYPADHDQHRLLVRHRRPGVRRLLRMRRARRLPRSRAGAARDRVERVDTARHPDLLLRGDVGRPGARRPRRRRHLARRRSPPERPAVSRPRWTERARCASRSSGPARPASTRPRRCSPTPRSTSRWTCSIACPPRSAWSAPASPPTIPRSRT